MNLKALTRQFIRYIGVGGTAALIEWGSFYLCNYQLQFHYLLAVVVAFTLATGANYILSILFVFQRGRHSVRLEAFLVYLVSGVGLVLNMLFMWTMHGLLDIHAMAAKVIATGIVLIWNFSSRKLFIFKA
ncbi:MAG: GtrA family protein [Spirochaetia bacterium]|nr:GtrA family protein [Spirochaetia bacterium]